MGVEFLAALAENPAHAGRNENTVPVFVAFRTNTQQQKQRDGIFFFMD